MRIKENQVSCNSSSQYHWKWKWFSLRAGSLLLLCSRFGNRGKRRAWVLDFFPPMRNVQRALASARFASVCRRPSCMLSFAASVEHGGRNSEKTTSIFYWLPLLYQSSWPSVTSSPCFSVAVPFSVYILHYWHHLTGYWKPFLNLASASWL